jgi:hypothetical protein
MKPVFFAVLRLCREAGLVRLGLVTLDGSKVQGNASLEANREVAGIEAETEKMRTEAEATDAKERARMDRKLHTRHGCERYRRRGAAVEPVFGYMEDRQGARRFSMRGLERCPGEWNLHGAMHNLPKLHRESVRRAAKATERTAERVRKTA